MMRYISTFFSVIVFVASAIVAMAYSIAESNRASLDEVCTLIETNYFRAREPEVQKFLDHCFSLVDRQPWTLDRRTQIRRINYLLSGLKTSHLSVYEPAENKAIWESETLENGIRSRLIEGSLVVYKVVRGSPADRAGVQVGDVVVESDGVSITNDYDAKNVNGLVVIERKRKRLVVSLRTEVVMEDMRPRFDKLAGKTGLLTIPSFLPQYFDRDVWRSLLKSVRDYDRLVIDLRGNSGGSFPAMIRAVSPFHCAEPVVGSLQRNTRDGEEVSTADLPDDLDTLTQIHLLEENAIVRLKVFDGYECFNKPVAVLVDSGTASTAEIFAQSFFRKKNARVIGHPTAGQVVMARWFSIRAFGGGDYAMAIPIAGYRSSDGDEIESYGLIPHREVHYDLSRALDGQDSWILDSISLLNNVSL